MRTIRFRDVLWDVAYKMGLDPQQDNFLTNQAVTIGAYIDQWVRRLYDSQDWPEWTKIVMAVPDPITHIVPYTQEAPPTPTTTVITYFIGRVFKVYLIDPFSSSSPIDTKFTLRESGIHCGFEHGSTVWIEYIEPPPRFTAEVWVVDQVYSKEDVVYSYRTGHCYKSKLNNNVGHDPSTVLGYPPPSVELLATRAPGSPGASAQNKIIRVELRPAQPPPSGPLAPPSGGEIPNPPPANSKFYIPVTDDTGLVGSALTVADGSLTLANIVTDLSNQLISSCPGYTITPNATGLFIDIAHSSEFYVNSSTNNAFYTPPTGTPLRVLKVTTLQPYIAEIGPTQPTMQQSELTLDAGTIKSNSVYRLNFRDTLGEEHLIEYGVLPTDGMSELLIGIQNALSVAASIDPFFQSIQAVYTGTSLQFNSPDEVSIDANIFLPGSPYWELVPFPLRLAEPVIDGAYADLQKEWGQTDKAAVEQQNVAADTQLSTAKFDAGPNTPLVSQQRANSRIRLTPP